MGKESFGVLCSCAWLVLVSAAGQCADDAGREPSSLRAVRFTTADGQAVVKHLVPYDWVELLGQGAMAMVYREGRELRFSADLPRFFLKVDDGPRRLLGVAVRRTTGLKELRDAVAAGATPLTIDWSPMGGDMLPHIPERIEVTLTSACLKPGDVLTLAETLPRLTALKLSLPPQWAIPAVLESLAKLENLRALELDWMGQAIPTLAPLARLKELRSLRLRLVAVKPGGPAEPGLAPMPDVAPLAGLAHLHVLDIGADFKASDIQALAQLKRLVVLRLGNRAEVSNLSALAQLPELRGLELSGFDQVRDLSSLAGLAKLERLRIAGNPRIGDLGPLARLQRLRSLALGGTFWATDLAPLSQLAGLEDLDLGGFHAVTDLSPLARMPQLTSLRLSGMGNLRDAAPLGQLKRLTTLHLNGLSLSDISPLRALPQLGRIHVSNCQNITDITALRGAAKRGATIVVPKELQPQLPELKSATDF